MYRAFNVKIAENEIDDLLKNSNQLYDNFFDIDISNKFNIQRSLENFLLPNNAIDVQSLEQDWFPSVDAHVFISHSHKDIGLVEKFEHWLYQRFGIKSFVDSRVWEYANELLKKIDDEYCVKQDTYYGLIYDYEKRNISTSHVHMILATALLKMIDKMDYVFFFNTPNSLSTNNIRQMTYSPWIYYELLLLNFIRKNSPRKLVEGEMRKSFSIESKKLTMAFPVDIKNLYKLSMTELSRWEMDVPSDEKYPNSALMKLNLLFPDIKLTDNLSKRGRIYG